MGGCEAPPMSPCRGSHQRELAQAPYLRSTSTTSSHPVGETATLHPPDPAPRNRLTRRPTLRSRDHSPAALRLPNFPSLPPTSGSRSEPGSRKTPPCHRRSSDRRMG